MRSILFTTLSVLLMSCGSSKHQEVPVTTAPEAVAKPKISLSTLNVKFDDTDRYDWTSTKPWRYPIHGIDVSWFQGDIDWEQARASGVNFAFIKATEGGDHMDEKFTDNWQAAGAANVLRGAYHFYYFCRTASEQARWFIENVPNEDNALPPVLDMEWNQGSKTCRYRPSAVKIRNEMRVYLDMVKAHYGKSPIIYVTPDFYEENELWRVRGYSYWLRSVANHPADIYRGQAWAFWQYTGTGEVPGIKGNVDLNTFAGSVIAWQDWVVQNTRVISPVP